MAEFQHTVNVGVDVAVQGQGDLNALTRALRALSSTAQGASALSASAVQADRFGAALAGLSKNVTSYSTSLRSLIEDTKSASLSQSQFATSAENASKSFADSTAAISRAAEKRKGLADATRDGQAANDSANKSLIVGADAALRLEQANARLLQSQGKVPEAIKTIQKALDGFTGSQIQATRAQIQLSNLQNDYANSPLISAVRAQTEAFRGFATGSGNVEKFLKKTAEAGDTVGDSLGNTTATILAQGQALAQLQRDQGDVSGSAKTLEATFKAVADAQAEAVREATSFRAELSGVAQAGAAFLNVISAGFNFFSAIQREAANGLSQEEAAGQVVAKAFRGAQAAASALKSTVTENSSALRVVASEARAAASEIEKIVLPGGSGGESAEAFLSKIRAANEAIIRASSQATAGGAPAGFLEKIRAANDAIVKAGREAGQSFSKGVSDSKGSAEKSGEALGEATEKGVRDQLQQRSPSRVLLNLGREAAQSFASGFEAGKQKLRAITGRDLIDPTATAPKTTTGIVGRLKSLLPTAGEASTAATGVILLTGSVTALAASMASAGLAAVALTPLILKLGQTGLELNSKFEQTRLGIASVVASVGNLSRQGIKLEGVDALNAALPLANQQLQKLRIDALQTALTFKDIAPGFLQAIGPGLAAGLNLDQIRKAVVDLSQLIIPLTGDAGQLGQELRSIFSGDIGPDSQVAFALQITKGEIEAAKEAGTLADLLNKKLAAAAATGALMAKTFEAAKTNLAEAGDVLAASVTKPLFDTLRDDINKTLPQIFETAGDSIRIAPEFAGIENTLTEIFRSVGEVASDTFANFLRVVKDLSGFLKDNQQEVSRIVDLSASAANLTIQAFIGASSAVAQFVGEVAFIAPKIAPAVVGLATLSGLMLAFGPGATAAETAIAVLGRGMTALISTLTAVRASLAATSAFLFTTPAGWVLLAAAATAAAVTYLAFNDAQKELFGQADRLKLDDLTGQFERVKAIRAQLAEAENLTGAQSNLNAEQERFNRILGTLTPQQQAVIGALGNQKAKVDELKQSLKEALAAKQAEAQAEQVILLAAVAARQREIDATNEAIKRLQEQLRLRNELLKSGQTTQTETIGSDFGEALTLTEDIAAKERDLANERLKSGKQLDELNKAQQENIVKLRATLPLLGLTEEQLLKESQAGRLTTEQFGLLKKALDSAGAASGGTAAGADNVSAALSAMQKRAQDAQRALETLFSTGDATELRKQVTDRVNQITGQALKAGSGVSGALGEFNKALKDSNDPLASQVKNLQDFEKIQTALNEKVAPKKATGGGGRSTIARDALADIKSRDDLFRAQFEREIALQQNTNQRLQAANQSAFDRQLKGVRDFLERKRQLEEASAELDLRAARTAAERANGELLRIQQAQSQTKNKADQQRLAGEEDRVRAEIVRAEEAITLAQRRRADVGIQASRDLQKALEDEAEKLREIEVRFLEITDKQSAAARLTVGAESDRQLKSLNLEFAAVTALVEKAQAEGRTADAEALAGQQERLRVAIQQTEEIRRQSLLNLEFGQAQRELTDIDRARSLALDEQQRKLEAVGATDDEVTKQRRAVMKLYQEQIDAVIERLQILQNQGARNPEIEKTIQDLQNRKKNETALSLGQQLSPGIGNVDQIFAERQRQIDAINRSGTLTSLEKDQARKSVIEATNRQLERQLELLRLIFAEKGLPLNEQFKELENRVKESNNQTQSFGTTLRDVAQQGAINSLTGFFTDIASGAKSFKDAALDALGSFIQALQQAVIQAIVLKLVLALFGGGAGAAVPAGAAKGGAVAGLAEGGAVRPRRYASGGEVQYDPTGLLRGPGGGRADKILAYFPAANRVARVSNTEYVLDAETTRNLGVGFLDRIRAAKGRVKFGGGFAEGGAVSAAGNSILNVSPNVAGGDTNVALNQTIQLSPVEMTRRALKDRSVVRDILEVIGSERTRVNATLSS